MLAIYRMHELCFVTLQRWLEQKTVSFSVIPRFFRVCNQLTHRPNSVLAEPSYSSVQRVRAKTFKYSLPKKNYTKYFSHLIRLRVVDSSFTHTLRTIYINYLFTKLLLRQQMVFIIRCLCVQESQVFLHVLIDKTKPQDELVVFRVYSFKQKSLSRADKNDNFW